MFFKELINMATTTKKCSKCGKRMSVKKFYKDSSNKKTGLRSACKECEKK
jgi:hypothetical protein